MWRDCHGLAQFATMEFTAGCYVSDAHAYEIEGLLNLGVTHVLVLGDAPAPSGEVGFRVQRVPLPASDHFERAAAFLRAAVRAGGRACVLCASPEKDGAALACFYLMRDGGLSLRRAIEVVRGALPGALPPAAAMQRLMECEARLRPAEPPSLAADEYKWLALEQTFPATRSRDAIAQQLRAAHSYLKDVAARVEVEQARRVAQAAEAGEKVAGQFAL